MTWRPTAEAAGWDGFFVWDHLRYGERVSAIADVWTCCAAVAMRTERLLFGPMVTPLARRRPQVVAQQAASLAVLSGGRFVLGLGLGDDWVGEFSAFGDEPDPVVRGRMLDEGLEVLTAGRRPVDHAAHYPPGRPLARPEVPIWLAGRFGNRAPLRRAARHDGFFVIDLDGPRRPRRGDRRPGRAPTRPGLRRGRRPAARAGPRPWLDRARRGC